jgi:hypothetical protein
MERYCQALGLRLRELDSHLKMNKKELRRARKTVKTYETVVSLGKQDKAAVVTSGLGDLSVTHNSQSASATALALVSTWT